MTSGSVFGDEVESETCCSDSDEEKDAGVPRSTGVKSGDGECWNGCWVSAGWL